MNLAIEKYILKNGKKYKPAPFPDDLEYGKVGDCFDCCVINACKNRKYKYVEGLAKHPHQDVWIMHAWLVDDAGNCYDPTWYFEHEPTKQRGHVNTIYLGIELDLDAVIEFMHTTEYKSIMANGRRDLEKAEKILPGFPFPNL